MAGLWVSRLIPQVSSEGRGAARHEQGPDMGQGAQGAEF